MSSGDNERMVILDKGALDHLPAPYSSTFSVGAGNATLRVMNTGPIGDRTLVVDSVRISALDVTGLPPGKRMALPYKLEITVLGDQKSLNFSHDTNYHDVARTFVVSNNLVSLDGNGCASFGDAATKQRCTERMIVAAMCGIAGNSSSCVSSTQTCSSPSSVDVEGLMRVAATKWDLYISIGSECSPALTLKTLGLRDAAYPFDWVESNPMLILDILKNGWEKALTFNSSQKSAGFGLSVSRPELNRHVNAFGQTFIHHVNWSSDELQSKLDRQFRRFFDVLNGDRSVLFVKTAWKYVVDEKERSRRHEHYNALYWVSLHLQTHYPNLNFHILNMEHANEEIDTELITNLDVGDLENNDTHPGFSKETRFVHRWTHRATDVLEFVNCVSGGNPRAFHMPLFRRDGGETSIIEEM